MATPSIPYLVAAATPSRPRRRRRLRAHDFLAPYLAVVTAERLQVVARAGDAGPPRPLVEYARDVAAMLDEWAVSAVQSLPQRRGVRR